MDSQRASKEKVYEIPEPIMHRLYNVLSHYANVTSYQAPRIGGVVAGCPRGETPTPDKLVWSARWMLREIEREILKRDAWDWIGKYEPVGPHCDSCRCGTAHEPCGCPPLPEVTALWRVLPHELQGVANAALQAVYNHRHAPPPRPCPWGDHSMMVSNYCPNCGAAASRPTKGGEHG